jgi:uncharacterized protein involved in outer membrane biogenesis
MMDKPQPTNTELDGHTIDGQQSVSAYDQNLKKLTDKELAQQTLELRAKVDAHMKEMARRFADQNRLKK